MTQNSEFQFYLSHSKMSDPKEYCAHFSSIPHEVSAIASTVQGLLLHDYFGAYLYADPPARIAEASRETLPVFERLPTVANFGVLPLTKTRAPRNRTVGTCRDFALLTCSIMRHKGIPARVRCGFALYFHPPTYEDHWICEYWDEDVQAWKIVDAQLDEEHRRHLSISFDPTDVPREQFLLPWQIWEQFGSEPSKLEVFGHGEAKGFWFLRVNLARDFLALLKREASSWDGWRQHGEVHKQTSMEAITQCTEVAAACRSLSASKHVDASKFKDLVC
ncbi:MAG: transglutaminase-like domain-containing protein, partial [Pseudomonadota bacterium]